MKRRFLRHLLEGGTEVRASEKPADGVPRLRASEGDDEMPLLSAPSGSGHGGKAVRRTCGRGPTAAGAGR